MSVMIVEIKACKVKKNDNVAIALNDVKPRDIINILDNKGNRCLSIESKMSIPAGHKVSLTDILSGEPIIKYNQPIGIAKFAIGRGEHVHIHNMCGARGRGDQKV